MGTNERLTDDELMKVSGGAGRGINPDLVDKRLEFDKAWAAKEYDKNKDITGMKRAEIYDKWTESGQSAEAFLGSYKI
ncbi:hypothetical protein D6855_10160 [Butyrivibrio sp. CB08]|uniref:hypothetical protein n=1 Tax=Butyrivibrio sp. CB08 TaxID=2364879 RepID=UPI000EA91F58|nr:hypothetical protein [Butyrivibrio sp. CB08]RKM59260.1 hypothetical protein D6855_10160 [Butyrivibrio sp. CB08]